MGTKVKPVQPAEIKDKKSSSKSTNPYRCPLKKDDELIMKFFK
jgi:hypothetical protein